MSGPDDPPVVPAADSPYVLVRLRSERMYGDRVRTRVFVGLVGGATLQLAGTLDLDVGEWQLFGGALLAGARVVDHLRVETPDDMDVVW